ncbi:hypothetical protein [Agriterribacter humi]|jgi:hypothetical protein|uniref:hypothetical protein n=1 Tax=Agriterribacter humi TaxID=1104781 RepID=UPI001265166B|nr:hypothetical protein [Agriterribacter humi]
MKKIGLIPVWIAFCFACNSNGTGSATDHNNMNDSPASNAAPTPGLGNDPTRNDASRPDPAERRKVEDSSSTNNKADPTPGLGNDPTRNDASKDPSRDNAQPKQDTGLRKN